MQSGASTRARCRPLLPSWAARTRKPPNSKASLSPRTMSGARPRSPGSAWALGMGVAMGSSGALRMSYHGLDPLLGGGLCASRGTGNKMVKRVPFSADDSASARPPCASAMLLTSRGPIPLPRIRRAVSRPAPIEAVESAAYLVGAHSSPRRMTTRERRGRGGARQCDGQTLRAVLRGVVEEVQEFAIVKACSSDRDLRQVVGTIGMSVGRAPAPPDE